MEPVEWCYDGLGGSIIKWTMEVGGSPKDHPSILAFLVHRDGTSYSRLDDNSQYQAGSFKKWLEGTLKTYEKDHPSTRMPFITADVRVGGTDRSATCNALEEALEAKKPALLYFGRETFEDKDKAGKKENKAARKFEKTTPNSKTAAKLVDGWVLLRVDMADEDHAALAEKYGVKAAPTLLMFLPGAEQPEDLKKVSGNALAYKMKKAMEALNAGDDDE